MVIIILISPTTNIKYSAAKVTYFELVYKQGIMLPIEVNFDIYKLAKKKELYVAMYNNLIVDNIDDVTEGSQGYGDEQDSGCLSIK